METVLKIFSSLVAPLLVLSALASHPSRAEEVFPTRPIHVINPYAAGGIVDNISRLLTNKLSKQMGVPFVVEPKPGGGSSIGTEYVARAPADGYTWLIATTSNAANMALMPAIRTDLKKDFVPVAQFAVSPNYLVVPASSPISSVDEYVKLAKSKPDELSYGHAGVGSTPHLGFELFKHVAGIRVVAVPYKGAPPIIPDLLSGQLSAAYMPSSLAISLAKSKKIKVLAVVGETRTQEFPSVPTMGEAGYPKAVVTPWYAILVPTGTPLVVVKRIETEIRLALESPEVSTGIAFAGAMPRFRNGIDTERMIDAEIESWRTLVKAAGLNME